MARSQTHSTNPRVLQKAMHQMPWLTAHVNNKAISVDEESSFDVNND
jgi:hypothetical protein